MPRYQYETSPRKQEQQYKNAKEKEFKVIEKKQKINQEKLKIEKAKRRKQLALVILAFAALLIISYRNSVINEEFKEIQKQKSQLATIEKENKQLEISIESSLNLNNVEKIASEQLGMKKQTGAQTVYIELPKEDYVETSAEEIEKNSQSLIEKIMNIFK